MGSGQGHHATCSSASGSHHSDSETDELLGLNEARDLEILFPTVQDEHKLQLLRGLDDVCSSTIQTHSVTRFSMLTALGRAADAIEDATAPVNGVQHQGMADWLQDTTFKQYASGVRLAMLKLKKFLLRQLKAPSVDQQLLRETLLEYVQAVDFHESQ